MLKKNTGYAFAEQFRRIQDDVREYLEGKGERKDEK